MARSTLLLLTLFAVACTEEAAPAPAPEATAAAPAEPAGPSVVRDQYALAAHAEPEGYVAGTLGQFEIALEGRSGWHINQEFPISVALTGPEGVEFAKARLERPDATEFTDDGARFSVAFTPEQAGEQPVGAHVSFAMCTDENCIMHEEHLALNLAVR